MTALPHHIEERIERLWCIGSTRRIAELLGINRSTVIRHAKQLGLKPLRHFWTATEDDLLRTLYPNTHAAEVAERIGVLVGSVHHRAARLGIRKDKEWVRKNSREVQRRNGNPGRFRAGLTPWNKGKQCPGLGGQTSFKPGNLPHNWVPISSERISKDGYLERKVRDDRPARRNFEPVHVLLWEQANGPVPPGHAVVFRDGNKRRIELDNLELVTRAELLRRNSVHRYPEELKQAIRAKARLSRAINQRLKHEKSHDRSA